MQKFFLLNEDIATTFKHLVEQNGGKGWPEIAKTLESIYNIRLSTPFRLKTAYQDLIHPDIALTKSQKKLMISLALKHTGNTRLALPEFQQITGINIPRVRFLNRFFRQQKDALYAGVQAFLRNKSDYRKRLQGLRGISIARLLQCKDLKSNDLFTLGLKLMAEHLEVLFQCVLDVDDSNDEEYGALLYEKIAANIKRRDFFLLLNCISFLEDLRCIFTNKIKNDEDLMPDYWLQPTIEENKNLQVYKFFFLDDMSTKYDMFTASADVQENINSQMIWNNAILQPKKLTVRKIPKLKTVRGKITVNDRKYPSDYTIKFDVPEEEESQEEKYEITLFKRRDYH